MRVFKKNGDFSVNAISGTYVVLLGMNTTQPAAKGLLGFAVHRTDHTENEEYWIKGFRTFKETLPNPVPGSLVSTQEHPVQAFLWGDYTAKASHKYTYKVVPMFGTPQNLKPGTPVEVSVSTEEEDQGKHAVYFNRGVAGSQAYARKFHNQPPDKVPNRAAFIWLSRGLEEAMLAYIGQAKGKSYGLRAAVYEFNYGPALEAFGAAAKSGADVKIVYDARPGTGHPVTQSDAAIKAAGIRDLMIPRTKNPSYIAHNKFIVLLKDEKPIQVWTGSTNFTAAGIFGHSNVGHIVRDPDLAQKYLDYWDRLSEDPDANGLRKANCEATPDPKGALPPSGITPIFSPRTSLAALTWYGERMGVATNSVFFTAAFGVNKNLSSIFAKPVTFLRYLLLEKQGATFNEFKDNRNNRIAIGALMPGTPVEGGSAKGGDGVDPTGGVLRRWLQTQLTGLNKNVKYLHTKYMLLDVLTTTPTVFSGSANFSDASTRNNDENMILIQGNTAVADIYLGEFIRLWHQFYATNVILKMQAKPGTKAYDPAYLDSTDGWAQAYFQKGRVKPLERLLFCGDNSLIAAAVADPATTEPASASPVTKKVPSQRGKTGAIKKAARISVKGKKRTGAATKKAAPKKATRRASAKKK